MRVVLAFLPCVVLAGCVSTGFNRGALHDQLRLEGAEAKEVLDEDIQQVLALKPQLTFPCRIAVYLRPGKDASWHWTPQDKDLLNSWSAALGKEGIASNVVLMNDMFTSGADLKHLRLAAARYGADALLIVQGASVTDGYENPAALLNLTIIGGYVVPGSHRDALFIVQAGLVDVHNGCLYATAESEGEGHIMRPTFIIEDRDAIARAKKTAMDAFGPELLRQMRGLCSRPAVVPAVARQ